VNQTCAATTLRPRYFRSGFRETQNKSFQTDLALRLLKSIPSRAVILLDVGRRLGSLRFVQQDASFTDPRMQRWQGIARKSLEI
jgi:hypothetical protein